MIRQIHLTLGAFALFAVAFGAMLVGSAGDSYAAPTLVVNGTFDDNVANWTEEVDADAAFTWDGAMDLNSDANSGSGRLEFTGTAPGAAEVRSDCFALTGDGSYPYEAFVRPGTQWTTDDSTVNITFVRFDAADCGGSSESSSHGTTTIGTAGAGWVEISGAVTVNPAFSVSALIVLTVNADAQGDFAWWDELKIADTELDTPTPTPSPVATDTPVPTDTPVATNTPAATNTPLPTDTPVATSTPVATDTPIATNTAEPTSTTVPPTNTPETLEVGAPPEAELDNTGSAGAGGEEPEGSAGAGAEEPEAGEVPESGYGPDSYSNERSHVADIVALVSFTLAIIMLGAGFALRKNYEEA